MTTISRRTKLVVSASAALLLFTGCRDTRHTLDPIPGPEIIPASELSGVRLVFVNDAGLFAINGDATGLVKLADGEFNNISLSRDRKSIVFDRGGNIYTIGTDGSGLRQVTMERGTHPAWSPDGTGIVFSGADRSLHVIDLQTGALDRLTKAMGDALDYAPDWSPDGRHVAFTRRWDDEMYYGFPVTFVVSVDGTTEIQLPTLYRSEFPKWSPDGNRVAFTGHDGQVFGLINSDGSGLSYIPNALGLESIVDAWSPEGSLLALTSRLDTRTKSDIYLIDARGRTARVTTDGQSRSAVFLSSAN